MKTIRVALTVSALLSSATTLGSQARGNPPVRLVVLVDNPTISVGESANITVQLKDVGNQITRARKDYWIYVEVRDQKSPLWSRSVPIKAGSDSQRLAIPFDRVGVFMIKGVNPELREGAIFVNVKPKRRLAIDQTAGFGSVHAISVAWRPLPQPGPARDQADVEIIIKSTDEGSKLNADGREAALIQVFLPGPSAPFDITLRFFCSVGDLQPNPVVIRSGEDHAEARLTSTKPGQASIELVTVDPRRGVMAPRWTKSVQFLQPYSAHVAPARNVMTLTELSEDVQVGLVFKGSSVKPEEPVAVTLQLNANGELIPSRLTLTRDEPVKSVQFAPRHKGRAVITATPFGGDPGEGVIEVRVPWALLLATMSGGFLGGLSSVLGTRFQSLVATARRGLLGIFTALVFYWTIQSGLIHIPPSAVSNAVLALLASLLAGYLGTKLIDVVWKSVSKAT